jgi:plastocyanin
MRRLPALSLTLLAVLALAACSSSATPGWTYAPAASASAIASGAASGQPSAAPSAAESVAPSVAASAAPSAAASAAASGGAGTIITITAPVGAATAGYQETSLEAKANTPFTIHFDNQDSQAPHNVQLKGPSGDVALGGDTAFFTGPGTRDYTVPALAPGVYEYMCQVHPTTMKGTLTVN